MIARSLAYVCVVSMVLVIGYLIGYQAFKFIKRFFELLHVSWGASHLGFVKIFIWLWFKKYATRKTVRGEPVEP
ncbi:hypothetical protein IM753_12830 [Moraxella sp. K127]|nr:hypothetical protein [Moraxella sp. K127]